MNDIKSLEEIKAERKERKERLKKTIAECQEELDALEPAPALKWRGKMSKKDRVECERRLIGRFLCDLNYNTHNAVRDDVARLGISWRLFVDKRHQLIWRSLETLNTKTVEERMDILEEEMLAEAREKDALSKAPMFKDGDTTAEGVHILKGLPGTAAAKEFKKALIDGASDGAAWFIRELDAVGALALAGGKMYLRELAENGDGPMQAEEMAEILFGSMEKD